MISYVGIGLMVLVFFFHKPIFFIFGFIIDVVVYGTHDLWCDIRSRQKSRPREPKFKFKYLLPRKK